MQNESINPEIEGLANECMNLMANFPGETTSTIETSPTSLPQNPLTSLQVQPGRLSDTVQQVFIRNPQMQPLQPPEPSTASPHLQLPFQTINH